MSTQNRVSKHKIYAIRSVCALCVAAMTIQTAGRGTIVILAVVLCLGFQGDTQQVDINLEVGTISYCRGNAVLEWC